MNISTLYILYKEYINSAVRMFFSRYSTFKKFSNLLKALISTYFTKTEKVDHYPVRLYIDPTNICNLRCPLCPTGRGEIGRERGFMELSLFRKIVDELRDYLFQVDLYLWGEPLLNKQILSMINYCHRWKIRTRISTHFSLMKVDYEGLVRSGLDELIVSLDGASPETYDVYRIGGKFGLVIDNIRRLSDAKSRLGSKNPEIVWQYLVMAHNDKEIQKAKDMAKSLGVRLRIVPARAGIGESILKDHEENSYKGWASRKISRYKPNGERRFKITSCLFLWLQSVINWDGGVAPCCPSFSSRNDFGNVSLNSFWDIWNGERYVYARHAVKNKLKNVDIICSNCIKRGYFVDP